jgi:hypothetical protein
MVGVPRASKSMRAQVRRLKAEARREGRPVPHLHYNSTSRQWEIKIGS